jgi:hypothetical protein
MANLEIKNEKQKKSAVKAALVVLSLEIEQAQTATCSVKLSPMSFAVS